MLLSLFLNSFRIIIVTIANAIISVFIVITIINSVSTAVFAAIAFASASLQADFTGCLEVLVVGGGHPEALGRSLFLRGLGFRVGVLAGDRF